MPHRRPARLVTLSLALPAVGVLGLTAGCGTMLGTDDEGASNEFVTIATGGTGGAYYPIGGAMGNMLANEIDSVRSGTAETTGGSVENLQLVGADRATLGMAMNDAVSDAVDGERDFDEPQEICTVAVMYQNVLQLVTTQNSGIESFADLAGQRVSVGDAGSATELMFRNVAESIGVDFADFATEENLPFDAQTAAIRNRQLDVGAYVVAPGASSIQDLASSNPVRVLPLTDDEVAQVTEDYGDVYVPEMLPQDTYEGMEGDVQVATTWNSLVMNSNTDQEFVAEVTRAVHENVDVLAEGNPAGGDTAPENVEFAIAPVCEGSMEFFEEAGVEVPENARPE